MYENNLPVPIGVGLSLFSTKNVYIFDFNGANICENWFGFFSNPHVLVLYILIM